MAELLGIFYPFIINLLLLSGIGLIAFLGTIVYQRVSLGKPAEGARSQPPKRRRPEAGEVRSGRNNGSEDELPNGYEREDYYKLGYTDEEIEYWGLDQPEAPSPTSAGMMIAERIYNSDYEVG